MSHDRRNNLSKDKATTTAIPVATSSGLVAQVSATYGADSLIAEAKIIAKGVSSLASHFCEQVPAWQAMLRSARLYLLPLSVIIGAIFAVEQYFGNRQKDERTQMAALFSATTNQLASPYEAIQAGAVRSLPQLGYFKDVVRPLPNDYFIGAHLINRFVRSRSEYPFMKQSWLLFRDFAVQPRTESIANPVESNIVSSALLWEGTAWEKRLRTEKAMMDIKMSGALLYKAKLANAQGIDGDYQGINFGAVDLTKANLVGSKFDNCGLSGAQFNDANLTGVSLKDAYLAEAQMRNVNFSFSHLDNAMFKKTILKRATFTQTILVETDFTEATLDKATFNQATMSHTIFKNASLRGAVFSQTDVSSASFEGADVEGADFTTAIGFSKGILSKARNVQRAHLPAGNVTRK